MLINLLNSAATIEMAKKQHTFIEQFIEEFFTKWVSAYFMHPKVKVKYLRKFIVDY